MKSVLVLSLFFSSLVGSAASRVQVAEFASEGLEVTGIRFVKRAETGRAWIDVLVFERACSGAEGCDPDGYIQAKVPGLRLEGTSIVAEDGTVCATYRVKSFGLFSREKETRTGLCDYDVERGSRRLDDGFEVRVEPTTKVFFKTR